MNKTVAIIGASSNRAKYGNKAVRAFLHQSFTVYPVNPTETQVEGLKSYPSIMDIPQRPEIVSVYVPPSVLLGLLPDIARRGCDELAQSRNRLGWRDCAGGGTGTQTVQTCSILAMGLTPAQFPSA